MYPSFDVDPRIPIMLEIDLAVRLGEFIVKSGTADKQIMAFGHRLVALEEKEDSKKWIPRPGRQPMRNGRPPIVSREGEDKFSEGLC
jgi:hypothetical protein